FISHFTPDYLCQNVTFSGNEKEITVSLSIVLEPKGSGRGKPIRFSRKYSHEAKEIEYGRLPEVRVWPEYQEEDLAGWQSWFMYYNDLSVPKNKLAISPRPEFVAVGEPDGKKISRSEERRV